MWVTRFLFSFSFSLLLLFFFLLLFLLLFFFLFLTLLSIMLVLGLEYASLKFDAFTPGWTNEGSVSWDGLLFVTKALRQTHECTEKDHPIVIHASPSPFSLLHTLIVP